MLSRDAIAKFLLEEDGPTAVEYAVILAMIVMVCVASVSFLATQTAESFNTSATAITGAFGN